jgi:hypothetical protein
VIALHAATAIVRRVARVRIGQHGAIRTGRHGVKAIVARRVAKVIGQHEAMAIVRPAVRVIVARRVVREIAALPAAKATIVHHVRTVTGPRVVKAIAAPHVAKVIGQHRATAIVRRVAREIGQHGVTPTGRPARTVRAARRVAKGIVVRHGAKVRTVRPVVMGTAAHRVATTTAHPARRRDVPPVAVVRRAGPRPTRRRIRPPLAAATMRTTTRE